MRKWFDEGDSEIIFNVSSHNSNTNLSGSIKIITPYEGMDSSATRTMYFSVPLDQTGYVLN